MVGDEKALLAKLRRDVASHLLLLIGKIVITMFNSLVILEFLEFLYPMRFIVFSTGTELLAPVYDSSIFSDIRKKEGELTMNLIALFVIVVIDSYLDKIVLNTESEIQIKEIDELLV